jgi:hypothetical protein
VHLQGRAGSGRLAVARTAAEAAHNKLLVVDACRLGRAGVHFEASALAAWREAQRLGAALVLRHADWLVEDADRHARWTTLLRSLGGVPGASSASAPGAGWAAGAGLDAGLAAGLAAGAQLDLWLLSEGPLPLDSWLPQARILQLNLPAPGVADRERAWQVALQACGAGAALASAESADLARALAAGYRTHHGEIAAAARRAAAAMQARTPTSAPSSALCTTRLGPAWQAALQAAAAHGAAPRLGQLAQALPTRHRLSDLVLPPEKLEVLADLVRRVRHRRQVMEDWGFDGVSAGGRGLVALFHGPSGTGKSMAADALAGTLGLALYRIDLAGVVSKYIGETEKNLRAVFDEAERCSALLLFDEADALFGKRSEVKDAHDRYANIEVNYLLQRVEQFDGIAVLTTNKPAHLDDAFQRRLHVSLEFTLPKASERRRLWQRSFPAGAPLAEGIDWDFIASQFEVAGGTIRNAALSAAYLAAELAAEAAAELADPATAAIGQRALLLALRSELSKTGRRLALAEFGPYQDLLALQPAHSAKPAP